MQKKSIILADCEAEEIAAIKRGLDSQTGLSFEIINTGSNRFHGNKIAELKRYADYFLLPLKVFLNRPDCNVLVGWQQFHAINYAFYCRLFRAKRDVKIFAVNFTYKKKPGLIGKIYDRYMRYAVHSRQLRGLHVLSNNYAGKIAAALGIERDMMLVTRFGTVDNYDRWSVLPCECRDFALAIGRSNRDFDFIAKVWNTPKIRAAGYKLIIISDTWRPATDISDNPLIIHLDNIHGAASYPYFANCGFSIIPIDEPSICSGDTVLINSMMLKKAVVVTAPSTLSEMYVTDRVNGLYIGRDIDSASETIHNIITGTELRRSLGEAARKWFVDLFSRDRMAADLGRLINDKL